MVVAVVMVALLPQQGSPHLADALGGGSLHPHLPVAATAVCAKGAATVEEGCCGQSRELAVYRKHRLHCNGCLRWSGQG